MLLRHLKYLLPPLSLVFLLSVRSVQASAVRQHFADAKSILSSTKFLNVREFFEDLREALLPGSSHIVYHEGQSTENVLHAARRVHSAQSQEGNRRTAGDGNFVIIESSPGKKGHLISTPQIADERNPELNTGNDKALFSNGAQPVTVLGGEPAESGSDHENTSDDTDANTSKSKLQTLSSGSSPSPSPLPEADVHLDVATGTGNPRDSTSKDSDAEPTNEMPENTLEVELSFLDPSTEELLNAKGTKSGTRQNDESDDGDDSVGENQSNSDDLNRQPSTAPGPKEQPLILLPPDTEDAKNSPDPDEIDDNLPYESAIPVATVPFESFEATEATSESVSPESQDIGTRSPLNADGKPLSPANGESAEESAEPIILVDLPLSVRLSEQSISHEFDGHARNYLGQMTGTTAGQWKPTNVSSTIRGLQRQDGSRWEITYQGRLSEATARRTVDELGDGINNGEMDTYLNQRLSSEVRIRTASAPILDTPQKDEVPLTGTVPKETSSGIATMNTEEESGGQSLGMILGTCFGLLGALIAAAAVFASMRRRRGNDEHTLDGVATVPTTLTSFETERSESQFRTGAPTKPRGPTVLRNQSRILDWQMDHATPSENVRRILGRGNGRDENVW